MKKRRQTKGYVQQYGGAHALKRAVAAGMGDMLTPASVARDLNVSQGHALTLLREAGWTPRTIAVSLNVNEPVWPIDRLENPR